MDAKSGRLRGLWVTLVYKTDFCFDPEPCKNVQKKKEKLSSISCNNIFAKLCCLKGLMEYHEEIADYFNRRGVSIIFLFRRNLLRRMISLLANTYDKDAKLLNGTHKSHVHSPHEVI